jgi:hypothetical protein
MATPIDAVNWALRDLQRFSLNPINMRNFPDEPEGVVRFSIFTKTNEYLMSANDKNTSDGYLGCISKCRTPRAGEDWRRGRDLADGPLSEETWANILRDIVSYELVNIATPAAQTSDIPAKPGKSEKLPSLTEVRGIFAKD